MSTFPDLATGTWVIDPVHSSIEFTVRHLMVSKVRGRFDTFEGAIVVDENGAATAKATIDVASIDTRNADRDAHIKSADFFEVEKYPSAEFVSTGVSQKGGDLVLSGNFTLHGVTKPIELELEFFGVNEGMGNGPVAGFEARTTLNRKDYGITIEMPLAGGGTVVGDKINLVISVEAGLQA